MKFNTKFTRNRVLQKFDAKKNPSRTQQAHKDSTLIDNILAKHRTVGIDLFAQKFDSNNNGIIDVSEIPDFQTYHNKLAEAQSQFMQLPASLRRQFNDSPESLLAFLANPANRDEAFKLGLLKKIENVKNENVKVEKLDKNSVLPDSVPASTNKSVSNV